MLLQMMRLLLICATAVGRPVCRVWDGICVDVPHLTSASLEVVVGPALLQLSSDPLPLDRDGAVIDSTLLLRHQHSVFVALPTQPERAQQLFKTATAHLNAGQWVESLAGFRQAIALWPDFAAAHANAGKAWLADLDNIPSSEHGRNASGHALWHFQRALYERGYQADRVAMYARQNLALVLTDHQQYDRALAEFDAVLHLVDRRSGMAQEAMTGKAVANLKLRQIGPAIKLLQHVIGINADNHHAYRLLVGTVRYAILLQPNRPRNHYILGRLLWHQGHMDDARHNFELALTVEPAAGSELPECARVTIQILLALQLPPVFGSIEAMHASRELFIERLEQLGRDGTQTQVPPARGASNATLCDIMPMAFTVVYHGMNAKPLIAKMGQTLQAVVPTAQFTPPSAQRAPRRGSRVRVGFISAYLDNHPAGRAWGGVIVNLPKDKFEVFGISLAHDPQRDDHQFMRIRDGVEHYLDFGKKPFNDTRNEVWDLQLDVLVYLEIGMDATTYFMAFARLAPVQVLTYGHSMTSGIDTIDYFVSVDSEVKDAQDQYTEKLVRFKSLGVYFYPPDLSPAHANGIQTPKTRSDFGLPEGARLYVCPQSMHKMHPEFDLMLASVLRADRRGIVVLIDKPGSQYLTPMIQSRMNRTIADVVDRIRILPTLGPNARYNLRGDFLALVKVCDVMLDSYPVGGGTSSMEAFGTGIPIVTLAGPSLPGRFTMHMNQVMGLHQLVATDKADYTRIAVEIANSDQVALRRQITNASKLLYEDQSAVDEWAEFLTNVRPVSRVT